MTGKQPPYIKREIEDKIVRMLKMIDRLWSCIEMDKRMSFLNYYYIIYKLLELYGANGVDDTSTTSQNQTTNKTAR